MTRIQRHSGRLFLENARYFEGYSQKAAEETDYLIDAMVRR